MKKKYISPLLQVVRLQSPIMNTTLSIKGTSDGEARSSLFEGSLFDEQEADEFLF